jgi:hypothetical protein
MTISFDIPNAKAELLLDALVKRYAGLTVPETNADKATLLNKLIQQQLVESMRAMIREQKQVEAVQQIQADVDLAETPLEAELKSVVAEQA